MNEIMHTMQTAIKSQQQLHGVKPAVVDYKSLHEGEITVKYRDSVECSSLELCRHTGNSKTPPEVRR